MPYIITTRWDGAVHPHPSTDEHPNPLAVATLDEARDKVRETIEAQFPAGTVVPMDGGEWAEAGTPTAVYHDLHFDVDSLEQDGGTIGPLPDGTVIEVRQVDGPALAAECGIVAQRSMPFGVSTLIDEFNAR